MRQLFSLAQLRQMDRLMADLAEETRVTTLRLPGGTYFEKGKTYMAFEHRSVLQVQKRQSMLHGCCLYCNEYNSKNAGYTVHLEIHGRAWRMHDRTQGANEVYTDVPAMVQGDRAEHGSHNEHSGGGREADEKACSKACVMLLQYCYNVFVWM
jgi:hypothetical protein